MISNTALSTLAERYSVDGYCVVEGLVEEPIVSRLLETASSMESARAGTYAPIPMPHRAHPFFLEFMRYLPIVTVVERLVGGRPAGIGGEFFYSRPGVPGFVRHQDNAYVQAPKDAFVSVWTALTDVDEENGCLVVYPGSHRLGTLPARSRDVVPAAGQNPGAEALETILPDELPHVSVPLKRGSTIFFHGDLVHESLGNRSKDRFRHAFLATYVRSGVPFRPGRLQQRSEVALY
jgi:phytanoyl-CoA hydroxylase